jgi:hypothetical protein
VDSSYVPADFVVIETGGDEKSPIILGRPFLNTAGSIMYANIAKICFNIKGKREAFFFKDKVLQFLHTFNILMSQRRRTIRGIRTRIGSHNRWSQ